MKIIHCIFIIFFITSLMWLVSCSPSNAKNRTFEASKIIRINLSDIDKENMEHASNFVNHVSYIPLETNDMCLIGEITKLIVRDDKIYIHDKMTNKLLKFSITGKFESAIGNIGAGPGEYIRISSFFVDSNHCISIYCEIKQAIITYDEYGKCTGEMKTGFVSSDFIMFNGLYYFYGGRLPNQSVYKESFPWQYRLAAVKEGSIVENYFKFRYNEILTYISIPPSKNNLYVYNDSLSLIEGNNIIYRILEQPYPVYAVDFGKYNVPFDYYNDTFTDKKCEIHKNAQKCQLSDFFEMERYIFIYFSSPESFICVSIYDKKNDNVTNLGVFWKNDMDHISMPRIISTYDKNHLVGFYYAEYFKKMIFDNDNTIEEHLIAMADSIDDSDNPIISIISFK